MLSLAPVLAGTAGGSRTVAVAPVHRPSLASEQHNASSEDEEYSQDAGGEHIQQMFKNMIAALDKQRRDGNEKIEARAVLDRQACLAKAMEAIAQAKNRHAAELEETKMQMDKCMAKASSTMTKSLVDFIADVGVVHKDTVAARKQAKMESAAVANDVKTLQTCGEQVCANLEKRLQQITSKSEKDFKAALDAPAPLADVIAEIEKATKAISSRS